MASVLATGVVMGCLGTTGSPGTSSATAPPATRQPTLPPDDVTQLVLDAAGGAEPEGSDLDVRWRAAFDALAIEGEQPYEPPAAVLGYRAGDLPDTVCATGDPERWRNAALYCPGDHRIVYDEDWLRSLRDEVGIEAALAILAHEWGHHVQSLLGVDTQDLREELQADCYAAMYLMGSGLIPHTSDDEAAVLDATMTAFFGLGNTTYQASEWFGAHEHGSPIQRIMATSTGLQSHQQVNPLVPGGIEKGLPSCFGYADYRTADRATIGQYTFVELPGRASGTTNGIYVMDPETRTGQPGSTIQMEWLPSLPNPGGATDENLASLGSTSAFPNIAAVAAPMPLYPSIHGGTGRAFAYQSHEDDGSNPRTGVLGLVAPSTGAGGLLVLVFQPRIEDTDAGNLAILEEALVTITQVTSRLCTPDERPDSAGPSFDPVCTDVQ